MLVAEQQDITCPTPTGSNMIVRLYDCTIERCMRLGDQLNQLHFDSAQYNMWIWNFANVDEKNRNILQVIVSLLFHFLKQLQ
jgi:hypothetical protein